MILLICSCSWELMGNLQLGKGPPHAQREREGAPSAPRDYIGRALPPRTPPFLFLLIFDFKKLNVWARFRLKKLSVWARFGGFL